ncbi:carbohydrate ABC transporter permease [Ectobacillus ponti]|uniref:Sugar ABC transporter permease n=1 Tax=Ectobacillus ponti TaxID=2961894 RepID=A0AA42BRG2_9BACI|nr:sugar ABC transporter permease [Ectobacillus ponti]
MAKKEQSYSSEKKAERRLGYLLVTPALILILAIAVWPVLQSFYFSLFDYKLTDPAKSSIQTKAQLDLERYANNYPFLMKSLQTETDSAKDADVKSKLTQIIEDLRKADAGIQKNHKEQYDKVSEMVLNYENPTDKQKFAQISADEANQYDKVFSDAAKQLNQYKNGKVLQDGDKVAGLASSLDESIVKPNLIGLGHYKTLLSSDRMWHALRNTGIFTIISVIVETVLGLAIALLINKAFFGRGLVRATILIPWAIPTAVSALMWKFLYDGQNGIVAKYFADLGIIHKMSDLLTTGNGAMFAVVFADVWKTTPYMALLLLAGLQTIPDSLYEAASMDGATKTRQFFTITLPLLKSSLLVALLFRTLDAFRVFDLIYVLTGGGPANSTETISMMAYNLMFSQSNFGEGSAIAVIVFICVAIISIIYIKFLGADLISDGSKK